MTARAKEIPGQRRQGGNSTVISTNTAIALPLSADESEEIASEPFAFQLLQLCFVFLRFKYSA